MKKLPRIYQKEITKNINNNKKVCYLNKSNIDDQNNTQSINDILDEIFNGLGYSYNVRVEIITNDKVYKTSILSKTKENIITIDNDIIPIKKIIKIKKVH